MTDSALQIRSGVAAIVRDGDGRVPLHRSRAGAGWAPPSGAVEPGEDVRAALHRGLREETTLAVADERLFAVYSDPAFQIIRYPDGRTVHAVTCLFDCRVAGGAFAGSDEGLDWAWFAPDALPADLTPYARIWLGDALALGPTVAVRRAGRGPKSGLTIR